MVADEGLAGDESIIVHFGAPEANASVNERCGGLVGGHMKDRNLGFSGGRDQSRKNLWPSQTGWDVTPEGLVVSEFEFHL